MKTVSVRELLHHFSHVLHRVEDGEEIHITKRERVVARFLPPAAKVSRLKWPDFEERLNKIFPRGMKGKPLSQVIDEQRGERP